MGIKPNRSRRAGLLPGDGFLRRCNVWPVNFAQRFTIANRCTNYLHGMVVRENNNKKHHSTRHRARRHQTWSLEPDNAGRRCESGNKKFAIKAVREREGSPPLLLCVVA